MTQTLSDNAMMREELIRHFALPTASPSQLRMRVKIDGVEVNVGSIHKESKVELEFEVGAGSPVPVTRSVPAPVAVGARRFPRVLILPLFPRVGGRHEEENPCRPRTSRRHAACRHAIAAW
jgi:hypothetical protein